MPNQTSWEPHGIHVRHTGHVTDLEIAEFARTAQADERYPDIRYVLHDFLGCEGASFSRTNLEELSATDGAAASYNPNIKIAVVAENAEAIAAAQTYMSIGLHSYPMRIFSTLAEARAWLGYEHPL